MCCCETKFILDGFSFCHCLLPPFLCLLYLHLSVSSLPHFVLPCCSLLSFSHSVSVWPCSTPAAFSSCLLFPLLSPQLCFPLSLPHVSVSHSLFPVSDILSLLAFLYPPHIPHHKLPLKFSFPKSVPTVLPYLGLKKLPFLLTYKHFK